ncbi:hypothetical protein QVD17_20169 [Tagetes erecta]|uniref:Uncharacterized protein n=1 Tax=Tagetes erecta TaxID=13708 RepID=A0AAD8NXY8_TARER|nr:hypothetical protein QVD17_20169 [Tagetes erecta]
MAVLNTLSQKRQQNHNYRSRLQLDGYATHDVPAAFVTIGQISPLVLIFLLFRSETDHWLLRLGVDQI